ncbi:unnamed protein product [Sphagnum balticum]
MKHVLLPCQFKIQISPRSGPKFTQWDHRPWQFHPQQSTHTSSVTRKLVQSSFDDEFRSSQQIALGLHRRYKSVLEGGFTNNLREFINAGVTAYAVGCTDEGLRKELLNVGQAGAELDGSTGAGGGANVVLKSKIRAEEVEECILWVSIVFITILCTPQPTIVRWSSTPAVSAEAQVQWRGFCALIANAYYVRGMAWLPVKTLQMEQLAVVGYAEEPSLVADRMRLVFATLEAVSPQWPKR